MPIGLTNALATCQEVVNDALRDVLNITAIAYIDDVLIFTTGTRQQHTKDVGEVLERLSNAGFRTALEKCKFFRKEVDFLGFIVGTNGIRIDPEKIQSIIE